MCKNEVCKGMALANECCIFSENLKEVNFEDGDKWKEIIKPILKEKGFSVWSALGYSVAMF